jgi:hypothetical protein
MRWRPYNGFRIERPGFRTSVTFAPRVWYEPPIRVYGCVWHSADGWRGYFERHHPGEIEDVELGPYPSQRAARAAIASALSDRANVLESDDPLS